MFGMIELYRVESASKVLATLWQNAKTLRRIEAGQYLQSGIRWSVSHQQMQESPTRDTDLQQGVEMVWDNGFFCKSIRS